MKSISISFIQKEKLYKYLLRPFFAGVLGFVITITVLFLCDLFFSILGIQNLMPNKLDLVLAGLGFLLKFAENLLKAKIL